MDILEMLLLRKHNYTYNKTVYLIKTLIENMTQYLISLITSIELIYI